MTSKLTRDIIQSEIADFFAGVVEIHTELGGPNTVEEAQNQLTERVLACVPAVDCEPVAVVEPSDYVTAAQLVGEGPARKAVHELYEGALRIGDKLYRHAQPAPVVTFYRDGIDAAAKWVDQQREAYDSEHGWSDPDTGAFEYGNDAQREYSSTLEELAEGIRALHPNAGMQPAPVVPDDVLDALQKVARIRLDMNDFDGDRRGIADCLGDAEEALIEVVNRRAAMFAAAPQDEAKKDKPHNNFGTGARLTNHRFKV